MFEDGERGVVAHEMNTTINDESQLKNICDVSILGLILFLLFIIYHFWILKCIFKF